MDWATRIEDLRRQQDWLSGYLTELHDPFTAAKDWTPEHTAKQENIGGANRLAARWVLLSHQIEFNKLVIDMLTDLGHEKEE